MIRDEFTALPISRQRKWQLRAHRDGLCWLCRAETLGDLRLCDPCEEKMRVRRGSVRKNSTSKRIRLKKTLATNA